MSIDEITNKSIFESNDPRYLMNKVKENNTFGYTKEEIDNIKDELSINEYNRYSIVKYINNVRGVFNNKIDGKSVLSLFITDLIDDKEALKAILDELDTYSDIHLVNAFGLDLSGAMDNNKTYFEFNVIELFEMLIENNIVSEEKIIDCLKNSKYTNIYLMNGYITYKYITADYNKEKLDLLEESPLGLKNVDLAILANDLFDDSKFDYKYLIKRVEERYKDGYEDRKLTRRLIEYNEYSYFLDCSNEFLLDPLFKDGSNILDKYLEFITDNNNKERYSFTSIRENQKVLLERKNENEDTYIDKIFKSAIENNQLNEIWFKRGISQSNSEILTYKSKYLGDKTILEYLFENNKELFISILKDREEKEVKYSLDDDSYDDIWELEIDDKNIFEVFYNIDKENALNLLKELPLMTLHPKLMSKLKELDKDFRLEDTFFLFPEQHKLIENVITKHGLEELLPSNLDDIYLKEIERFKNIMLSDGLSDENIVELAANAFKISFSNDPKSTIKDINSIINIKESDSNFAFIDITKHEDSAAKSTCFSRNNKIYIENEYNVSAIIHEMTHAIHYNYNKFKFPEEFDKFTNITKEQAEKIKKIAKKYDKFINEMKEDAKTDGTAINRQVNLYAKLVNNDDISINTMNSFYLLYTIPTRKKLKQEGYDSETIEKRCDEIIDPDKLWDVSMNKIKEVVTSELIYKTIDRWTQMYDIFDAMSSGYLFSDQISNDKIEIFAGHGSDYYNKKLDNDGEDRRFNEIIAQYAVIKKMPKSDSYMQILENIFGKEYTNMLDNFYNNMYVEKKEKKELVNDNENLSENSIEERGRLR